eukprot:1161255-Pelagomonas_calceolata.AAC.5
MNAIPPNRMGKTFQTELALKKLGAEAVVMSAGASADVCTQALTPNHGSMFIRGFKFEGLSQQSTKANLHCLYELEPKWAGTPGNLICELEHEWAGTPGKLIRERYKKAGELSANRGKLSVLLINDIDAGLGEFLYQQKESG